jgi:hypothetical protein
MSVDVAYLALGELEKLLAQYEEKVKRHRGHLEGVCRRRL